MITLPAVDTLNAGFNRDELGSVNTSGGLKILGGIQSSGRCTATSSRFAAAWARPRRLEYVQPAS
jgi:hypothetical protein